MTTHAGLPVVGYQPQSDDKVRLANEGKELEERYLRWLEKLGSLYAELPCDPSLAVQPSAKLCDPRCLSEARTCIQTGAMWAVRAIFQPQRIKLPEDGT